jgi:acetylornithine/N-succinyldiaminopimelate aminotransferase
MSTTLMAPEEKVAPPAISVMEMERQVLVQNYARYPLVLARGKGCYVYDTAGRRYLDLIAGIGVNALGHAHPRIVRTVRDQAAKLIHCSNLYYHEYQAPLAKKLAKVSGLARCFFSNSGTEAVEGAMKMARAWGKRIDPQKYEFIALENSFHGRTMGALAATGQAKYRADFEPLVPGVRFVPANDIDALEHASGGRMCAVLVEAIQGEGGIHASSPEFLRRARELCDRYDALLIFDEIQCGVGRPGTHFSYQLLDPPVMPDVVVAAKPLACGIPLGVIIANDKAAAALGAGTHGSTFGGGALACRVALEFLDELDALLPQVRRTGDYFRERLNDLARRFPFVREVRAFGLMIGVDLAVPGKQIVLDAIGEGLLINCTHETVLRFLPPYIITEKQVDAAISKLRKLFRKV